MLNVEDIKKDFPIMARKINGKELVYLDSAATSQKPLRVIEAITDYYKNHNANVHRGIHTLSEEATEMYENSRKKVSDFIVASRPKEVIFTAGATDSLNMVAMSWAAKNLKKDDEILITDAEHHSNLVPWQIVSNLLGTKLKVLDLDLSLGNDFLPLFEREMTERVKLVSLFHASNVTGAVMPVKEVCKLAKKHGAVVSVDGAQAVPHMKVNVTGLGCDFYSFSSHKMLGPTGVGVLWAKEEHLQNMEPFKYGGGMIDTVETHVSTWADIPERFEAGTPNVAGVIGLGVAVDYLNSLGMDNVSAHEEGLNEYAFKELGKIEGLHILGSQNPKNRAGMVSFVIDGIHSHDLAAIFNTEGIAVRSGHHCTMPLHNKLKISSSTRASYYVYNDTHDIDRMIEAVYKAKEILG